MGIPIRWGDMDAMNHVNNTSKIYVSDPGRTTFESWASMERTEQSGVIYAAGGATTIWVDFESQKAKTMPDWMRALVSVADAKDHKTSEPHPMLRRRHPHR